jgi:hypothetical protein
VFHPFVTAPVSEVVKADWGPFARSPTVTASTAAFNANAASNGCSWLPPAAVAAAAVAAADAPLLSTCGAGTATVAAVAGGAGLSPVDCPAAAVLQHPRQPQLTWRALLAAQREETDDLRTP